MRCEGIRAALNEVVNCQMNSESAFIELKQGDFLVESF